MLNTHDYIKCYRDSFWHWDSKERFAVVKDGITFAYWDEIRSYLVNLSTIGLPTFDVFMAVMAASVGDEFHQIPLTIQKHLCPSATQSGISSDLKILETINSLDPTYRRGENRFVLVSTVLEKLNVKLIELVSKKISEELTDPDKDFFGIYGPEAAHHRHRVVSQLKALGNEFPTSESIIEAMLGFDRKIINLDSTLPQVEEHTDASSFLEQLQKDLQTEKMAALIPYVQSGMNFPIHSRQSSERPEGGVSDLSNKGHFDQLIVSEFAYDDDYFLSRIVNNEALYFQREKAKHRNDEELCVLIDSSLYMWGLPKVIATAIACSVGMKEEKASLDCFVVGDTVQLCDFRSLHGVLQGVRFAEASISPAMGISSFNELGKTYSNVLLVTTEESWKRKEMAHHRENAQQLFDFVVFTDEHAEIRVVKAKGKQVANFKLDLDTIWALKKQNISRKEATVTSDFPLLFPVYNERVKYYFEYNGEIYFIDRSRSLFKVISPRHPHEEPASNGARFILQVESNLNVLGDIGPNNIGELELLMFNARERTIVIYNLVNKSSRHHQFNEWRSRDGMIFYHENNTFYLANYSGFRIIDENFVGSSEPLTVNYDLAKRASNRMLSIKKKYFFKDGYLSKVTSVYISNQDELVIQGIRIEKVNENSIGLYQNPQGSPVILPVMKRSVAKNVFTFPSGEAIIAHTSGMMEFCFYDKKRPAAFELILTKVGGHKVHTIKLLRQITHKGLQECQTTVDDGKGSLLLSRNSAELNKFATQLRELGNTVVIQNRTLSKHFFMVSVMGRDVAFAGQDFFTGNKQYKDSLNYPQQQELTADEFEKLYLQAFIENCKHGN